MPQPTGHAKIRLSRTCMMDNALPSFQSSQLQQATIDTTALAEQFMG
jgi:hypothetical protein